MFSMFNVLLVVAPLLGTVFVTWNYTRHYYETKIETMKREAKKDAEAKGAKVKEAAVQIDKQNDKEEKANEPIIKHLEETLPKSKSPNSVVLDDKWMRSLRSIR